MTIKEIVKKYLIKNGYDGLCNFDDGCGCKIKDLMPCGDPNIQDCVPGHVLTIAELESEKMKENERKNKP